MRDILFPTPAELFRGARASVMLLRMQWGMARSIKSRLFLFAITAFAVGAVAVMSHAGEFVKFVAMEQEGAAQIYARTYLASFQHGNLGSIGAIMLGICLLSAIVSPFTGATSTSFIPPKDTAALSVTRWHRFTDSVIAQFMSSISILQLVALSSLASVLTLEGGRVSGLLLTWSVWFALVCLTNLSLWVSECVYRKFGRQLRIVLTVAVLTVVAVVVSAAPDQASTVFGLGTIYSNAVTDIATYTAGIQLVIIGSIVLFGFATLYATSVLSTIALSVPDAGTEARKNSVYRGRFALKGTTATHILVRSIVRSSEVRKPIISALVIGLVLLLFMPRNLSVNTTFTIIIPLVVALAWGSNAFAHLGGGAPWVLSQPRTLRYAPWTIFGIQVVISLSIFLIVWIPTLALGKATLSEFGINFMAVAASSVIVGRSATTKALKKPSPLHFGARSEASLPPQRALQYTLRMALWGGQYGILVLLLNNMQMRWSLLGLALGVQFFHMLRLQSYWEQPDTRRKIAAAVASD